MYDVLRELIIGFDISLIFMKILLAGFLFYHWYHQRGKKTGYQILLILGIFILSLALSRIFYIIHDFYYYDVPYNFIDTELKYIAQIIQTVGVTILIYAMEKIFSKKHVVSFLCFILLIFNVIGFFGLTSELIHTIINYSIPLLLGTYFIILFYFVSHIMAPDIKRKLSISLGGFILYFLGVVGDTEFAMNLLGLEIRILADILKMLGLLLFTWSLYDLSSFGEFLWKDKLLHIFIIHDSGQNIYTHSFQAGKEFDEDLVSGGLVGISAFLKEIINSEKHLEVIDHQDIKIIFKYGTNFVVAVTCLENLQMIHFQLAEFIHEFETFYQDILPNWAGNVDIFQPTKYLIEKYF